MCRLANILSGLFLSAILLVSCSKPSGHKVLTFFFDGVPPLIDDTLSKSSITPLKYLPDSTLRIETPKKVPYIFHSPYESKLCEGCHIAGSPGDLTDPEDELCLKCHTPYQDSFEYVHGPADAGLCMTCHDPHMSKREFLLIREEDEICTVCHYPGAIHKVMESIPAKDKHCTECHDPHGGKEKMFLIKSDKK